ncbi:THUMP domain-containing protein [Bdellovibrio bacteriovorus]|uniref:Putative N6-adenine-specific DNA methylase n=1 Tax=Bdellovibrio bacteriovorus (strain ATCC 15356 / DSM 50701 / NCIMB 9529 / HD100) TaxID=264462 RepID=Q6MPB2_BDEBA|nr:THUMP domain-containing protein [Bdellovibrio bacteriovorus]AHZ86202.1 N6-adenine-specific DNA methylase [Bdellovibrio bacteriovorus]BEV67438.1 Ribosomal RNA large subunit methyltransferase L [Bdellovibrio bacteriovorus]CAE78886.1 putative N6-adenine-specific DNA methylase [Bdellovibrio bacteriovorus HD100]
MPQFFASTARGLVEPLELELKELGLKVTDRYIGGVFFESNWEGCYKANLHSRLASRILKPVLDFTAYQPEELYSQILRHDFTKYIKPTQTISIDASVNESKMRDQRFVAMKVKDAIVDQFREKFGVRPDVDNTNPDLRIHVRAIKNQFNVAIDTSGDSLFKRGYRKEVGEAPLKENLAAGLLRLSEWDRQSPLVDFMCGSGTFLIEAAMMSMNIAPGINRKGFGFQNWLNYEEETWEKVIQEAMDAEKEELDFKFYGFDIDKRVLMNAKDNAKRAGVDEVIEFKKESVATVEPPVEKGLIIVNPPYGARIGDEDNLRDVYRDLSFTMKHRFKGWDAWILSGNKELIADLKLKSTRKHFVFNGNIECRFLKYSMF